jgi:hypothetical protein
LKLEHQVQAQVLSSTGALIGTVGIDAGYHRVWLNQGEASITIGEINWVRYARVWFDHVL